MFETRRKMCLYQASAWVIESSVEWAIQCSAELAYEQVVLSPSRPSDTGDTKPDGKSIR